MTLDDLPYFGIRSSDGLDVLSQGQTTNPAVPSEAVLVWMTRMPPSSAHGNEREHLVFILYMMQTVSHKWLCDPRR